MEQEREVYVVPLDEWHAQSISVFDSPATVEYCAVTSAGELLSALMLVFSPPPLEAKTFDILYEAGAQHIRTWVYSTGTVTTDGSATLAFSGTALTSNHTGAIIRFSTSTTVLPTPQVGNMDNVDNPYRYQRVLIDVTSTTAAVTNRFVTSTNMKVGSYTLAQTTSPWGGAFTVTATITAVTGNYNGASMVGLAGVVIKSHGSADRRAFASAVRVAVTEASKGVPAQIVDLMTRVNASRLPADAASAS